MLRSIRLAVGLALLAAVSARAAEQYGLGRTPGPAEIAGWDIDVRPDGAGLPPGRGGVVEGAGIFAESCAGCHGAHGDADASMPGPRLVGGIGTLATTRPVQTVGSTWPYAPALFDYIRRAMPLNAPQSLSNDQVYAVSAYILSLNGIVKRDAVLDAASLAAVRMPNRDGFRPAPNQPAP